MKFEEKKLAKELRTRGDSIKEIAKKLAVSKSSVSLWVRDIQLTKAQKQILSEKGVRKEIIEKRRVTRLINESIRRRVIIDSAKQDISGLSKLELLLIGSALYWAEGSKRSKGTVILSNGDPLMIKLMMRFFRENCGVPESKFRGYIHIHPHLDFKKAEIYWADISGIPLNQFYKTYRKPNISSKNKKDTLPFGTFDITICDTVLLLKIKGWIEKLSEIAKLD
ncbi:MAG: hypothetical protein HZB99_04565 [Candidatus Harrisonbacteria bacterium]|nr:hypothetical protein [Candidatus Harrisonbacteria bacterium]